MASSPQENGGHIEDDARLPASSAQQFRHPVDVEQFRLQGKQMIDFICDYYGQQLEDRPVRSQVEPGYLQSMLPSEAPETSESFDAVLQDVQQLVMPGISHWQSPSFFAYYPANSSFPAMLGDMISAAVNVIGFSWISSPACTELEAVVLDWFAKLLGLPERFLTVQKAGSTGKGGGVIQGTASEATLVALLAARSVALRGREPADALRLAVYSSDQAHSSITKACMIAGVQHVRLLETSGQSGWALEPAKLQAAIEEDIRAGLIPCYLCLTIGTTSSCAMDPVEALAQIARQHSIWVHVDAAYAGASAICPELRQPFQGLHLADSFNTNAHKWMLTNFDCSCLWVADAEPLKAALSLTPVYLRAKGNALDYKDWQIPLGRRFRSLKLWFVLRMYGRRRLQDFVRHHIRLAEDFAARVQRDERFEITAPPRLSLVCFALKGADNATNAALLESINQSGKAFLVGTELDGRFVLRIAIGAANTQAEHVNAAWDLISQHADKLLQDQTVKS